MRPSIIVNLDVPELDRHWTPAHIDFVVDDIDSAVERALSAGAKRESDCIQWRGLESVQARLGWAEPHPTPLA